MVFTGTDRKVLYALAGALGVVIQQEMMQMASLDDVRKSVERDTTVTQSAVTLLDGLSAQLKDVQAKLAAGGADTAALDQVIAGIDANSDSLANAVARNTVANDEAHAGGM